MSKYLEHSESIASYLDGNMNPDQMLEFEKQLHTDPVLRSEFELQQDIVHSLQNFRKTQLKARLDQVPVSVGPTALVGIKAAATMVISGIIGLGAYLYFTAPIEESSSIPETTISTEVEDQVEAISEAPQLETSETVEIDETVSESKPQEEIISPAVVAEAPVVKVETANPEENRFEVIEKVSPVVNTPNLINPDLDESNLEETIELPSSAIAQEGLIDNEVVEVETARKDSDMFHYQYFSGKLYLYGDFRDNPYEILELNSVNGKRLFILYNNTYYRIMDNQQEITPLIELTDQDIIQKLEIIQANK